MDSADEALSGSVTAGPEVEEFANALDNCLSPHLTVEDKRARILDLPRKFYESATRRLSRARPKRGRSSDDVDMDMMDEMETATVSDGDLLGPHAQEKEKEIQRLEREVQTWDLIRRLLPLRHDASSTGASLSSSSSRSGPLRELLEISTVARERHAVLQWLQSSAAKAGPEVDEVARELLNKANRGDIIAHGWLHTRSAIKLRKGMTAWPHLLDRQQPSIMHSHLTTEGAPLITQLDPDAVTRQGRKLEPADEYFERAIWLGCFEHLRRGSSLETLRDWCQERTELWRVVSMSAMLFENDDDDDDDDGGSGGGGGAAASAPAEANMDPESLALWRRMCFALARQGGLDAHERAVYGLLSGDISSVEKVVERWDDMLFAHYNALLRTQLDSLVLSRCRPEVAASLTQSFASFDAVQFLGEQEGLEKRLVRALESHEQVREEAMEPSKALQAAFIADDLGRHLHEQGLVLTEEANEAGASRLLPMARSLDFGVRGNKYFRLSQHEGLRVVSHVYVLTNLMQRLGLRDARQAQAQWSSSQESILAAYTDYLRRAGLQELIPLYCSILETPRQYEVLSWNMIHVEDPQRRLTQLRLVKHSGIDALKYVERQAALFYEGLGPGDESRRARDTFSIVQPGSDPARLGKMIKADFIGGEQGGGVLDSKHEYLIRSLEWLLVVDGMWPKLFSMGVKAYKYFLKYTHLNAARQLMQRVPLKAVMKSATGREIADEEEDRPLYDDVELWRQLLEQGGGIQGVSAEQVLADARSFRQLETLMRGLDNLETAGSYMVLSLETPSDRDFWGRASDDLNKTPDLIKPLLRGWLTAAIQAGDEELREIRLAYLPETVLAYISALHFAGTGFSRDKLLECMELAALVAERESDLEGVFKEGRRMTELLEAFTACSKALAVTTGESKRPVGSSSKRLRSAGWTRDVWSVKKRV